MHYPVIVVSESPDEAVILDLLAPYDENITVAPYAEMSYAEVKAYLYGVCKDWEAPEARPIAAALDADDIETLRRYNNEQFHFFQGMNEKGEALTNYNPKSKWDYKAFGGRWTALLNGEYQCRLKDFPRIRPKDTKKDLKKKFPMIYESYQKKQAPVEYVEGTFRNHLKLNFCYALLLPSGEWIEPGQYAWWLGALAEREENVDWIRKFNQILDALPQDDWVTLIDCHI